MFLSLLMLITLMSPSGCQRAATWDACNCHWDHWEAWSKCSRHCYGNQVRTRKVWVYETPSCGTFESCDGGEGGRDYQRCKTHCTYGSYDGFSGCRCPAGRYGVCCTQVVVCGSPSVPANGACSKSNDNNYDSVATYTCNPGYNMTGASIATCKSIWNNVGYWTESAPTCHFAESCNSNPCQNGGTCVNGLDLYTCVCPPGWSGDNCQTDVQPPVMNDCEENSTLHTADHEVDHEWTVPSFSDPHGHVVTTTSNYGSSSYVFPWGDFMVQYVATKPSNGLQTECKFQVKVRPFPCEELPIPRNGYVACNDWRTDYGQFCLIGCKTNFTLPRDMDDRQLYVCGSSGSWTPAVSSIQCEEVSSRAHSEDPKQPDDCDDEQVFAVVKQNYISKLKKSSFNSFCIKSPELCGETNVRVECS